MTLEIHNTMSRSLEPFRSLEPGRVKLFTCGPSVYRPPHVGNHRTFLFEDVLQKYLEFLGYRVIRVINMTDVEDKAVAEANQKNVAVGELTRPVEKRFRLEAGLLNIKLPEFLPKSSTCVSQAVKIIKDLLAAGYAYEYDKDIFFDPLKFKGFGRLYGLDMGRWPSKRRRFRKDTYPGRRWNLGDFILWHGYRPKRDGSFFWETDLGRGRPAWNIQDPAIITEHLGWRIDIHCGGVDNLYRHHDYTIAVVEALTGEPLAPYWLHGEHVLVEGAKMSKSKGNIVYLQDMLDRGYSPEHVRFYLIHPHYRSRLDLTWDRLAASARRLDRFRETVYALGIRLKGNGPEEPDAGEADQDLISRFRRYMDSDLDVAGAWGSMECRLQEVLAAEREGRLSPAEVGRLRRALVRIDRVLGVIYPQRPPRP
ncbi:MAG: class I tRNA ligase family protein [Desulfobacteraceae bacterium]